MRRLLCLMVLSAGLAGCATTAERAAQLEREVDEMIQYYGPACEKLGYQNNTDPWRDCILRLNAKDSYESTTRRYPNGFKYRGFYY